MCKIIIVLSYIIYMVMAVFWIFLYPQGIFFFLENDLFSGHLANRRYINNPNTTLYMVYYIIQSVYVYIVNHIILYSIVKSI